MGGTFVFSAFESIRFFTCEGGCRRSWLMKHRLFFAYQTHMVAGIIRGIFSNVPSGFRSYLELLRGSSSILTSYIHRTAHFTLCTLACVTCQPPGCTLLSQPVRIYGTRSKPLFQRGAQALMSSAVWCRVMGTSTWLVPMSMVESLGSTPLQCLVRGDHMKNFCPLTSCSDLQRYCIATQKEA